MDGKKLFMPKYPATECLCETCPFRADGQGYARDHPEFPQILERIELGMPFFCHQTVIFDKRTIMAYDAEAGEPVPDPPIQDHFRSCLGAVKYKRGEITLKPAPKKRRKRK